MIQYPKKIIIILASAILVYGCATTGPEVRHSPIGITYLKVEEGNYDQPPEPVGGYAAIGKKLRYPGIAREAGIERTIRNYAKFSGS